MQLMRPGITLNGPSFRSKILIGLFAVTIYILASFVLPLVLPLSTGFFNLGLPDFAGFAIWQTFLAIYILSPWIEEITRAALRFLLESRLRFRPLYSRLISAIMFLLLHGLVYTNNFRNSVVGPFIAAGLFAIYSDELQVRTGSLIPSIVLHTGVNIFLFNYDFFINLFGAIV